MDEFRTQTQILNEAPPSIEDNRYNEKAKLGTFSGVFVPTTLNVLSILLFLRYGFLLGQAGILGMLGMLFLSYFVNLLTTLSISAISTNGTVRGGGAYYMISRSLGPEFGGSIGLVFYLGQVLNSAMNVAGFCEPLITNFGKDQGRVYAFLPNGTWWEFLYASILLFFCTLLCTVSSSVFEKAGYLLFVILLISTFLIIITAIFQPPFFIPEVSIIYTGISFQTLRQNLLPHFTKNAAGSDRFDKKESYRHLFGIFYPSTAGIFAGASMSGDLKNPSKSIPSGTLWGLLLTFVTYFSVIVFMGASLPRKLLYKDVQVLQTVSLNKHIIILGEFSTSLFSAIVSIIGAASLLQAISKDKLLPDYEFFEKESKNGPIRAILFSYFLCQLTLFFDINQIASFITMAFLLTFLITNLACFFLKISSAPNFRPLFRYFTWKSALLGSIFSFMIMYVCDGAYATAMFSIECCLFILIHLFSPAKPWGDVSQALIYHQVRKYLLRLRQDHVKFWRPQILLFVDSPRSCWKLIEFCNSLKKGSLYILGHVVVLKNYDEDSDAWYGEIKRQALAWRKIRDMSKIKAFIQILPAPSLTWGVRNVTLSSGLGGMRPNIAVIGFFETRNRFLIDCEKKKQLQKLQNQFHNKTISGLHQQSKSSFNYSSIEQQPNQNIYMPSNTSTLNSSRNSSLPSLPTDECRIENPVKVTEWVRIIENLIKMKISVAVAKSFPNLQLPTKLQKNWPWFENDFTMEEDLTESFVVNSLKKNSKRCNSKDGNTKKNQRKELCNGKKYIDLWPIQMSGALIDSSGERSILMTNFDTYSLILQMGAILHTVSAWKEEYDLRVIVFVEAEDEVKEENDRISLLLEKLRIRATVIVLCLSNCGLHSYDVILKGKEDQTDEIDLILSDDNWWRQIKVSRESKKKKKSPLKTNDSKILNSFTKDRDPNFTSLDFQNSAVPIVSKDVTGKINFHKRRHTMSQLHSLGVSLNLQTHNLADEHLYDESDSDSVITNDINYYLDSQNEQQNKKYRQSDKMDEDAYDIDDSCDENFHKIKKETDLIRPHTFGSNEELGKYSLSNKLSKSSGNIFKAVFDNKTPKSLLKQDSNITNYGSIGRAQLSNGESIFESKFDLSQEKSLDSNYTLIDKHKNETSNRFAHKIINKKKEKRAEDFLSHSLAVDDSFNSRSPLVSRAASRRNLPSFLSRTTPIATVNPDADDIVIPSIMFTEDVNSLKSKAVSLVDTEDTKKSLGRSGDGKVKSEPNSFRKFKKKLSNVKSPSFSKNKDVGSLIGSSNDKNISKTNLVDFNTDEFGDGPTSKTSDLYEGSLENNSKNNNENNKFIYDDLNTGRSKGSTNNVENIYTKKFKHRITFNDAPAIAQHIILNEAMKKTSSEAAVIFTTLPIPSIGTHKSIQDSVAYVKELKVLCYNLPPVLLLNSQSITVTTSL